MSQIFRTKSVAKLIADSEDPRHRLRRSLGPWSLTALGLGAVIGAGIFVLSGTAAAGETLQFDSVLHAPLLSALLQGSGAVGTSGRPGAGPGIALSFFLTAICCGFAALCYAELASRIPVAGSAYTYAYATLGELVAWIIGWDLILEYAVSNMAVAVGFSAYFTDLLSGFGIVLPPEFSGPVYSAGAFTGNYFNVPSFVILMILTWLLVTGIRESAGANNLLVCVKVLAILLFVFGAARHIQTSNWTPFAPNGAQGILTGSAIVFFTYIGFDSVSTAAEESRNPQRDIPIAIVATLVVCTLLYVSVAAVLTGIVPYQRLANAAPVANALRELGMDTVRRWVSIGALIGMVSSLLVFQLGQARIWFAMSRDGLLPRFFSAVHPRHRTPHISTWIAGLVVGIPAGVWDIGDLADLANIGTLFAFVIVSAGVLVLRRQPSYRPGGFRVPGGSLLPILSIVSCSVLMVSLPVMTWLRFFVWMLMGLAIYWLYSRRHSEFAEK